MEYQIIFNCFHGTTKAIATIILNDKKFKKSTKSNEWLGHGIYFFIDDYEKAEYWAKSKVTRNKFKKNRDIPCVIYVTVGLKNTELLDLTTESGLFEFEEFYNKFAINHNINIQFEECKDVHERLCNAVNFYVELNHERIKAVKYFFENDKIEYTKEFLNKFGLRFNKGNQLSIFDDSIINYQDIVIKCV